MRPLNLFLTLMLMGLVLMISLMSVKPAGKGAMVMLDPEIPRTWDSAAMLDFELPLADPSASPHPVSATTGRVRTTAISNVE